MGPRRLWRWGEHQDTATGEWVYGISITRRTLVEAGPVLADCANNIASALDHVASAIAKARGHPRLKWLYFPWGFADAEFEKKLGEAAEVLGPEMVEAIRAARAKHKHEIHHVEAAKQISRDGKHWEIRAAVFSARGIGLIGEDFKKRYFGIPADALEGADSYEFHRGAERVPAERGAEVLIGIIVDGLDEGLPTGTRSIFSCAFRFVQGVIDEVELSGKPKAGP